MKTMQILCTRCQKEFESERFKTCDSCLENKRQYRLESRDKIAEANRQYRESNRELLIENKRQYRIENIEKMTEADRQYRESNREQIRVRGRKRYAENPSKYRKISSEWRKANPEKVSIQHQRRRARKQGSEGSYTFNELTKLFESQEGFCFYCGKLLYGSFDQEVHVDHKVPLSRGGSNNIENIALSCSTCNLKKGSKTVEEFRAVC